MQQSFLQQLTEFTLRHWWMIAGMVALIIWAFIEEVRSKALSATQISSMQLTHWMNREMAVVVDVRDAQAYRDAHILNSINIPLVDLERDSQKLEKYKTMEIVLVDNNGMKVNQLSSQLRKVGFEKISILRGGLATWKQDKLPLTKGK